ncbi:MAG TPA: GspE/PulE family protein [Longimicrobiales bacterium]
MEALRPDVSLLAGAQAVAQDLDPEYLAHNAALPFIAEDGRCLVATWRPRLEPHVHDDLLLRLGRDFEVVQLEEEEIRPAIQRLYGRIGRSAEELVAELAVANASPWQGEVASISDLRNLANEAPVVRLVNLLLIEALEAGASDVHLEGHEGGLRVRYRIDGVLQDAPSPPAHLAAAVVSRLKIMAELDIAERRVPQDGRIRLRLEDREVDVRVSTMPVLHGESVVLRLLDRARGRIQLDELGMAPDTLSLFRRAIGRPHGIVLVTGPTGSGKTTTLYAAVEELRTGAEKIVTVEDPVEYALPGICQTPVSPRVGFAAALRALLRQDPDIILVGEIRDPETAEIATQAALTGHLVLSTLHTNDAAGAITRLLDLGVADYLVASTLSAVLAQRLVRKVCVECAEECVLGPEIARMLEAAEEGPPPRGRRGRGCAACRGTGFRGRTGIYELLIVDDEVRAAILHRRAAAGLARLAAGRGMRTLRQDGWRQVRAGVTTAEEVLRVTTT